MYHISIKLKSGYTGYFPIRSHKIENGRLYLDRGTFGAVVKVKKVEQFIIENVADFQRTLIQEAMRAEHQLQMNHLIDPDSGELR